MPAGSKADAGERFFQRVLLAASLLVMAGLGLIAFYLAPAAARPDNIYFELQRQASLVYLGFWASIVLLGALLALMRRTEFLALYVLLLIAAEGAAHVYFYAHNWVYHPLPRAAHAFEPIPARGNPASRQLRARHP